MAEALSIAVRSSATAHHIGSLRRTIGSRWGWFVAFAGQPGMGWLVGSLLATNALGTAMLIGDGKQADSMLGAVLGVPFRGHEGMGRHLRSRLDCLAARADDVGVWVVEPVFTAQQSPDYGDGTVFVRIRPSVESASGLWSPTFRTNAGRTINTIGRELSDTELTSLRTAVVAAWPEIVESGSVRYATTPLEPLEAEVIKTDGGGKTRSVHWCWAANDAFAALAITVLLAGHPQRAARRRAAIEAARRHSERLTHCPKCRYTLAGLPTNASDYRTCPECGKVSSQYF